MTSEIHTEKRVLKYNQEFFDPKNWLNFVQLPEFETAWGRLNLTDDDLRHLEMLIMVDPARPPVITGTGGIRKMRFSKDSGNEGKRGGVRILYSSFPEYGLICLFFVYAKGDDDSISAGLRNQLKSLVDEIKVFLSGKQSND